MMKGFKTLAVALILALCLFGVMAGCGKSDSATPPELDFDVDLPAPYYITNNFLEDSSTGFVAQWHNSIDVATQKLQIIQDPGDFKDARTITVTGNKFEGTNKDIGDYAARNIFRAEVTGLTPNTKYKYRIGDKGNWSETYFHQTSSGGTDNFSFTVVSDPQAPKHDKMGVTLAAANAYDPDNRFFLMGGDIVDYIGEQPTEIVSYTEAASKINIRRPIAATQGNHDTYWAKGEDADTNYEFNRNNYRFGESKVFNAFVTYPKNGRVKGADETNNTSDSYYFYYNKVLIVVLNTFATKGPATNASTIQPVNDLTYSEEAKWLKDVFEKDKAGNLSRYKIVLTHISPLSGRNINRWPDSFVRAAFGPICAEYKVDIFFAGHCHVYARSNPMKLKAGALDAQDFSSTPDGTVYSIVSATGPKFYKLDNDGETGTGQYFVKQVSDFVADPTFDMPGIFVNVKVTGAALNVTAKRYDGRILDTYTVTKK